MTSKLCVLVDSKDKESASKIFKRLGLNMTVAINLFLAQVIECDGLPFEMEQPSQELLDALEEGKNILKDIKDGKRKGYQNVRELFETLELDNE